ncbi:efflux RND transporter periplasmic adaptor subunit [Legionella sp. 31fI33]|nr:efflux RND transporter periplasmic adaptor subunit [Legionella sp. 31fI33]MCC5014500.1 efflux RND transporter periplasmic adaptor subunit [Legionella sp. 31fI33]
MKNRFYLFLLVMMASLLMACSNPKEQKKSTLQTYVVKTEPVQKTLYFNGTMQPIQESTLTSPMDAIVETMHFHYGQLVKKGAVVVTLNSTDLQRQYNDTLTEYLKAKDNFTVAKAKFIGTEELWDAGLLSKNNYLSEKSSLDTARVSLMQSTRKLSEMLEKMDNGEAVAKNLSALNIADFAKVKQALGSKHNLIHLKAPTDGVLLYPPKASEDKSARLMVGAAVKSGQVLALVGDLTGVSIEIDVPEIDIDKIHTGMAANITGVALGKQVLKGELVAVNVQASNNGGALPSFSAVVEVKNLTEEQRRWVKVGMSASVELPITGNEQLLVPIVAVKQEKGNSVVNVLASNGSLSSRIVSTGSAQADKVVIASGLKAGDVVAYD